jgi:ubiquinone/menaquinone biosynthesis C-methylase UbiE
MKLNVRLARFIMKLFPSEPEFNIAHSLSETINHKDFVNQDQAGKEKILYQMAVNHFMENEEKPFDSYFPDIDFKRLFFNKRVLDLGCWCGGKTVSYAERWKVKEMYGLDITPYFIKAAELFSNSRDQNIQYNFKVGFGESLPYEDNFFDAIVTNDVFEHVRSLSDTIKECKRVLKPDGVIFTVFPSYFTIKEHHLGFVTKMPIIHWLFSSKTLNAAFVSIIEERGDKAYWYYNKQVEKEDWRKLDGGIGINGTTFKSFKKIIKDIGFSKFKIVTTPILSVGAFSLKHSFVRKTTNLLKPIVRINFLQDFLSHRIIAEITK